MTQPVTEPVPHSTDATVVLYGREHCRLCDVAREVVRAVCADSGADWVEVDVDTDPDLSARHGLTVPVVEIAGKVRFRGVVNPVLLERLLVAEGRGR